MIPEADQPSETPSDIANRKMAQAEKKVACFRQEVPVTAESSGEPVVKPEDLLDGRIRERLQGIKVKYQEQFSFIMENFTIRNCCNTGSREPLCVESIGKKIGLFVNEYKTDEWLFFANHKEPEYRHHFYASNIIVHQYEYLSEANQTKMMLPKTIIEKQISGEKSIEVIHKYAGSHDSEPFKYEYLTTTDNGRFIARVADDFGLIIEGMKVNYDHFEQKTKHLCEISKEEFKWVFPLFNVTYRVSPNLEVYPEC
ncbi:hypothetical protein [Endozoicomonas sp. ALE010]|uniref:hypothetical protein n=1 Tax=Endozoicomonas sp. ALE010 TaxID=3403081 RepID=UPI003BB6E211